MSSTRTIRQRSEPCHANGLPDKPPELDCTPISPVGVYRAAVTIRLPFRPVVLQATQHICRRFGQDISAAKAGDNLLYLTRERACSVL